ncbi:MAG: AMP-dependent synthetase [Hydrocarboniphaga sp.]|uniref:class I adenylate-forming enzyme family protein n=1 Tax=Hydrocarboniphaga sp. TaxID=2033016 RepID=UPI0026093D5F|nr:AMP-binding protein [Hydrocarboniphaga sp.]MDB5971498.1 AMP-dependent synthetase [Hydrocarboniphaga sp.]
MPAGIAALHQSRFQAETNVDFLDWSVGQLLRDAAQRQPERLALIVPRADQPPRQWTYRELLTDAERTARALLRCFRPGDRVATWAGGSAEIVLLHLGAALAGIVLVTLNPANRSVELEYLLHQSQARGLVLDRIWRKHDNESVIEQLWPSLSALQTIVYLDQWPDFVDAATDAPLPAVSHDAPAMILFTSGTTGRPKGAILRHAGIVNNARLTAGRIDVPTGSVWLNLLPMFHVGGSVTMTLGCISNLGTQVLVPDFHADAMLDALQRYAVRITMAVPTMLVAMLHSERLANTDLSRLEVIVTGGTVVAPELVREVQSRTGAEVMTLFGQTEAGGAMCVTRRGDDIKRVTQSVGAPLPLSEAKIVSDTGGIVPIGVVGEICILTRCRMLEYFGMPEKTAETLDAEGWVHTGDLGVMRPDGYLQVTGRLKDMIIRGGENIYPREIEDRLAEHPAIAQSAVFGVPDAKWGEEVAAAVIFRPGLNASADELIAFLQSRIARHKMPKRWHFVESLPVNASGKIQKFILRDQYASPSAP